MLRSPDMRLLFPLSHMKKFANITPPGSHVQQLHFAHTLRRAGRAIVMYRHRARQSAPALPVQVQRERTVLHAFICTILLQPARQAEANELVCAFACNAACEADESEDPS